MRFLRVCALALLFPALLHAQKPASDLNARAEKAVSPVNGEIRVKGLEKPVQILRDRWGVAHIYAANQHDLFFAQGLVAAQDRLFQMELWKRAGQGRLAEVLGPSAVERDRYARLLRYRGDMQAEYKSYAPDAQAILTAFTDGINAWIRYVSAPGGPGLPIELQLAGFRPEPWKPEDCLSRMAAFSMTSNAHAELTNAELLTKLGKDKALTLIDPDPKAELDPAAGADYTGLTPDLLKQMVGADVRIDFPAGSNNWTVSGKLTETGKPFLANDPHRVMAIPSLRYIVHLVAPGWDVIGATEPALPGVAIGHNEKIAWGLTIFYVDQQDLYLEALNPANSLEYKYAGEWKRMTTETATIPVKGAAARPVTLKYTQHGPVLWEDQKTHRALALRWVGSEPGTAGYLASLSVDRAGDWKGFLSSMQRWKVPPENLVYADTEGNIGEQSAGLTPIRSWTGLFPVPGDGKHEWTGFISLDELPRVFNPPEGFYATANNRTTPDDYKYKVGYSWSEVRAERIRQVLAETSKQRKLRLDDMSGLQKDVFSIPADRLIRMLPQRVEGPAQPLARMLKEWDRRVTSASIPAAVYEVWEREVRNAAATQIVGGANRDAAAALSSQKLVDFLSSLAADARTTLLVSSLERAGDKLRADLGNDPNLWSWGSMHTVTFRHALDAVAGANPMFDLGPIARPGDGDTVNATGGSGYQQTGGASYREIFDLSNWDNSLAVNTPGQSGQPGSFHYADLLPIWSAGEYFPLVYSRQQVEENTEDKLMLLPSGPVRSAPAARAATKAR
jgi:penicillin amidase